MTSDFGWHVPGGFAKGRGVARASRMLTGVKGLYANTVAMAYDTGGRKSTEALTIAGQTYTTGTAYDTAGRVSQLTYPDGSVVARTYDSRNLLSTIALGGSNIDSRSYDAGGRLTSETLGNGQVVTRAYLTGDNLPALIANAAVGNYTYGWDANKNKTSETITGAMNGFSSAMNFDDQNRLTNWNRSNGDTQAWTLSPVNDWQSFTKNGTPETRTHGPAHEVLTVGAAAIQHDSRGNMTVDEFAISRTYDADGKVSQAVAPAGSARGSEGTYTYQYDVLGRRVRKTVGGSSSIDTVFVSKSDRIVADYAASTAPASPTAKYVWGSYVDELVCKISGSTKLYPHRNQQNSTTALTDQTGTVVERYAYTPHGDLVVLNPISFATLTTTPLTRYTYTGRELDSETASYHFRARQYSPTLGRFLSHDPILYLAGANTYSSYFSQSRTDPSGLDPFVNVGGMDGDMSRYFPPGFSPYSPGTCRTYDVVVKSFIFDLTKSGKSAGLPRRGGLAGTTGLDLDWWEVVFPFPGITLGVDDLVFPDWFPRDDIAISLYNKKENPESDAMDGQYRLYARYRIEACCCDGIGSLSTSVTAIDGGNEIPYVFDGTINAGTGTTPGSLKSWGRPNRTLPEQSFQLLYPRQSQNIWNQIQPSVSCDQGPELKLKLSGSGFPSHRLWVDGVRVGNIVQGDINLLWQGQNGWVN